MKAAQIHAKINHNGMQETLQFVVDRSKPHTILPKSIWRKLKLSPVATTGRRVNDPKISECLIEIGKKIYRTTVILGEKHDIPRLGNVTEYMKATARAA